MKIIINWVLMIVVIVLFGFVVYAQVQHDNLVYNCEEAGGVYTRTGCHEKGAVINL